MRTPRAILSHSFLLDLHFLVFLSCLGEALTLLTGIWLDIALMLFVLPTHAPELNVPKTTRNVLLRSRLCRIGGHSCSLGLVAVFC